MQKKIVFLISWFDCIWSSKFLSLPPIIRGVFCTPFSFKWFLLVFILVQVWSMVSSSWNIFRLSNKSFSAGMNHLKLFHGLPIAPLNNRKTRSRTYFLLWCTLNTLFQLNNFFRWFMKAVLILLLRWFTQRNLLQSLIGWVDAQSIPYSPQ